jgi:DHA1 family bicyclomycin/chloramphenicol resistance-like MFS transporter
MEKRSSLGMPEQIGLLALLISLVALSIDAILPALTIIGGDLAVPDPNAPQLLVSALLIGLSFGQLFYGPVSDSLGRRGPIVTGLIIFSLGSLLSYLSTSFEGVLAGRVLQGIGAAGPRVVAIALVRDQYAGPPMARIMSIVMAVFILVPALAPAIGQVILIFAHWRDIFILFLSLAAVGLVWFAARQPETLPAEKRRPLRIRPVLSAMGETLRHPVSRGYAISAGLVFGSFVGFLTTVQPALEKLYGVGDTFALYFAVLAIAIGAASITNSRLVMRLGMLRLCIAGLAGFMGVAIIGLAVAYANDGVPSLTVLMLLLMPLCFCFGILFGNFNALSMEPMGHIAGSASAVIASLTSLIAVVVGTTIGQAFTDSVIPLFLGFVGCAVASAAVVFFTETVGRPPESAEPVAE